MLCVPQGGARSRDRHCRTGIAETLRIPMWWGMVVSQQLDGGFDLPAANCCAPGSRSTWEGLNCVCPRGGHGKVCVPGAGRPGGKIHANGTFGLTDLLSQIFESYPSYRRYLVCGANECIGWTSMYAHRGTLGRPPRRVNSGICLSPGIAYAMFGIRSVGLSWLTNGLVDVAQV